MRNLTIRLAACSSAAARRHGLLLAVLAVPILAARAGEQLELPRAKPEEVWTSSE